MLKVDPMLQLERMRYQILLKTNFYLNIFYLNDLRGI
jgi:hypothetical protein